MNIILMARYVLRSKLLEWSSSSLCFVLDPKAAVQMAKTTKVVSGNHSTKTSVWPVPNYQVLSCIIAELFKKGLGHVIRLGQPLAKRGKHGKIGLHEPLQVPSPPGFSTSSKVETSLGHLMLASKASNFQMAEA